MTSPLLLDLDLCLILPKDKPKEAVLVSLVGGAPTTDAQLLSGLSTGRVLSLFLRTTAPGGLSPALRRQLQRRVDDLLSLILTATPDGCLEELRLEGEFTASHLAPSLVYHAAESLQRLRLFSTARGEGPPNRPLWAALRPAARLARLSFCVPGLRPDAELLRYGLSDKPQLEFLGLSDVEGLKPADLLVALAATASTRLTGLSFVYSRCNALYKLIHHSPEKYGSLFGQVRRVLHVVPDALDGRLLAATFPSLREVRVVKTKDANETTAMLKCGEVAGAFLQYHAGDSGPALLRVSTELVLPLARSARLIPAVDLLVQKMGGGGGSRRRCAAALPGKACDCVFRARKANAAVAISGIRFH